MIKTIEIIGQGDNKNTNKTGIEKKPEISFNQTTSPSLRLTPQLNHLNHYDIVSTADCCFAIQTEPGGTNIMKAIAPTNVVRDDIQAHLTDTGPSLAKAATTVPERRQSVF